MFTSTNLIDDILKLNVANASVVEASVIVFSKEFRSLCEQNKCGSYNKNWMCPPAVGPIEDLMAEAGGYRQALVFQTVHSISKSFDFKGMFEAAAKHERVVMGVLKHIIEKYGIKDVLPLGVGPCHFCKECTYIDGEECRFPDKAIASLEAYGIDVAKLLKVCGIPYHHGKNTVSYVGCMLFTVDGI